MVSGSEAPTIVGNLGKAMEELAPPGLVAAYLFGGYARGRAHRQSDLDIGVLLSPTLDRVGRFAQRVWLASRLSGRIGVREVDVVILNDAPPHLARRIVLDGILIVCKDAEAEHAFRRDIQLRAADLEPFLRRTRRIKLDSLAP